MVRAVHAPADCESGGRVHADYASEEVRADCASDEVTESASAAEGLLTTGDTPHAGSLARAGDAAPNSSQGALSSE